MHPSLLLLLLGRADAVKKRDRPWYIPDAAKRNAGQGFSPGGQHRSGNVSSIDWTQAPSIQTTISPTSSPMASSAQDTLTTTASSGYQLHSSSDWQLTSLATQKTASVSTDGWMDSGFQTNSVGINTTPMGWSSQNEPSSSSSSTLDLGFSSDPVGIHTTWSLTSQPETGTVVPLSTSTSSEDDTFPVLVWTLGEQSTSSVHPKVTQAAGSASVIPMAESSTESALLPDPTQTTPGTTEQTVQESNQQTIPGTTEQTQTTPYNEPNFSSTFSDPSTYVGGNEETTSSVPSVTATAASDMTDTSDTILAPWSTDSEFSTSQMETSQEYSTSSANSYSINAVGEPTTFTSSTYDATAFPNSVDATVFSSPTWTTYGTAMSTTSSSSGTSSFYLSDSATATLSSDKSLGFTLSYQASSVESATGDEFGTMSTAGASTIAPILVSTPSSDASISTASNARFGTVGLPGSQGFATKSTSNVPALTPASSSMPLSMRVSEPSNGNQLSLPTVAGSTSVSAEGEYSEQYPQRSSRISVKSNPIYTAAQQPSSAQSRIHFATSSKVQGFSPSGPYPLSGAKSSQLVSASSPGPTYTGLHFSVPGSSQFLSSSKTPSEPISYNGNGSPMSESQTAMDSTNVISEPTTSPDSSTAPVSSLTDKSPTMPGVIWTTPSETSWTIGPDGTPSTTITAGQVSAGSVESNTAVSASVETTQARSVTTLPKYTPTDSGETVQTTLSTFISTTAQPPDTTNWLPSALLTASPVATQQPDSSETYESSRTTSSPDLPGVIAPPTDPSIGRSEKEVQIGFQYGLNYPFVVKHPVAAAQIFDYLPKGISNGLGIDASKVQMEELVSYQDQNLDWLMTIAHLYVPSNEVNQLSAQVRDRSSELYHHPDASVRALCSFINATVSVDTLYSSSQQSSSQQSSESSSNGSNGSDSEGGKGAVGAPGSLDQKSQPDMHYSHASGRTAGIAAGTVAGAGVLGGLLFLASMAARKKYRKRPVALGDTPPASSYHDEIQPAASVSSILPSSGRHRDLSISQPMMTENSLGWQ